MLITKEDSPSWWEKFFLFSTCPPCSPSHPHSCKPAKAHTTKTYTTTAAYPRSLPSLWHLPQPAPVRLRYLTVYQHHISMEIPSMFISSLWSLCLLCTLESFHNSHQIAFCRWHRHGEIHRHLRNNPRQTQPKDYYAEPHVTGKLWCHNFRLLSTLHSLIDLSFNVLFLQGAWRLSGYIFLYSFLCFWTSPSLMHAVDAQLLTDWVRNWAVPLKIAHRALQWPTQGRGEGLSVVFGEWKWAVPGSALFYPCRKYTLLSPSTEGWFWWVRNRIGKCS